MLENILAQQGENLGSKLELYQQMMTYQYDQLQLVTNLRDILRWL